MHPSLLRLAREAVFVATCIGLAGCASTRLDEAPVSDASSSTSAARTATTPPAAAATTVAPVQATAAPVDSAGPQGTARVVYFDYDSAAIRPEFQPLLDAHARFMTTHPRATLTVAGHTDERGGHEYNLALGQQRAEAVRRALRLLGVPEPRVEAISFGEEKPASEQHDESAWSRNRRAELAYR
jgi:peptidoglycan-associated lipoprotein